MKENFENNYNDEEILEKITIKKKEPKKGGKRSARIDNTKKDKRKSNSKNSKGKTGTKKKLTKKQKIIIAIIAVIVILIGTVFGVYIYKANGNIAEAVLNVTTDVLGEKDPIFVLVLGVSEDISNPLTDTIILCGYNPDSQKAFMLSIPRDTFIGKSESSANGYDKINALYQTDVNKTITAVEKLTGINIDNYVVVRNTALPAIVDAIGEVEFDVPIDMDYDDPTQDLHIHLEKGVQKIDGDKAEQLLRFRHNNDGTSYPYEYGDNDYGRMRTQREFMKVVAGELVSWNSVTKLKDITTAVFENLETDMSLGKALGYVPYALKFDTDSIRMEQLPGSSAMINNLWFYKASSSKCKDLVDELLLSLELEDKELEKCYNKTINKNIKVSNTTKDETIDFDDEDDDSSSKNKVNSNTTQECEHNFSISLPDVPATCTTSGKISKKCSKCGLVLEETTPALGHNYSGGICTRCKQKDPNTVVNNDKDNDQKEDEDKNTHKEHNWKEVSRINATCGKEGSITYNCSCGATKTETIPATGKHNFSGATCTVCGANNPDYKVPDPEPNPDPGTDGSGDDATDIPEVNPPVTNTTATQTTT